MTKNQIVVPFSFQFVSSDTQAPAVTQGSHKNFMNGHCFDISNPLMKLRIALSSSFFGEPSYYEGTSRLNFPSAKPSCLNVLTALFATPKTVSDIEAMIDEALSVDPEGTLLEAVALRNVDFIRKAPQVIMVRAANHPKVRGTDLLKRYASQIMVRGDEPAVQLSYQLSRFGKPVPNALKKAWKAFLERQGDYQLAKYASGENKTKLVDVVNLTHATSPSISKLVRGNLSVKDKTWEGIISTKGSTPQAWKEALVLLMNPKGHQALLRNLRNLHSHGLITPEVAEVLEIGALEGKQLPFRYYSAYRECQACGAPSYLLDALENCMKTAIDEMPVFEGKVMSLADNSGSAQRTTTSKMGTMKVSTIANLSGILTAKVSDEGHLGIFGDTLKTMSIRKNTSVFDDLDKAERLAESIGPSTETGIWLFLNQAIKTKEHWDHIFVYSDMQAGHGALYGSSPAEYQDYCCNGRNIDVAKLVEKYRKEVNPNVMVYLVQVAGYSDTLIPDFYDRTVIMGGWSPSTLAFASKVAQLYSGKR